MKAREFDAAYEAANLRASSPIPDHFRHLTIGMQDPSKPSLIIDFTLRDLLPDIHEFPHIELADEYFRDLLKPEYRSAFDGMSFPECLAHEVIGLRYDAAISFRAAGRLRVNRLPLPNSLYTAI